MRLKKKRKIHGIINHTRNNIGSRNEAVEIRYGNPQKIHGTLVIILAIMLATTMELPELAISAVHELSLASHT